MGHVAASNALSRSIGSVPMWIVQTIVGLALSGGVAWCTWASVSSWKHEVRINVVESKVDDIHGDIGEIKGDVKEMNQKLDRLIERGNDGIRSHR